MFTDSDDSDDQESSSGFFFWNNWQPEKNRSSQNRRIENIPAVPVSCTTWLPPRIFGTRRKQKNHVINETHDDLVQSVVAESSDLSSEWGPRMMPGSSYGNVDENELTWNFFSVGVFGNFKLERNIHGKVVAFADAEIGSGAEKAFIEINKEQHLRKLLGVAVDEWNALIEALGSAKFCLKYEALKARPAKLSLGEKLWYFLCKRRHYLPVVAVRLRRNGAKKMAQFFDIFPRFRVEQIRTCNGQDLG